MKKNIFILKALGIIIPIFLFVFSATAQTKYDAEYQLIKKEYNLHADGSYDYTYRKELTLHSNRSFFSMYGETFIVYNPDYQSLEIKESYTKLADGTIINTPENAFNEVLPSNCVNCKRLNKMKEMVVTHTALEYNATIVLEYTIHSNPNFMKDLMEDYSLQEYIPILKYEISILIPNNKTLYLSPSTAALQPIQNQDNKQKICKFIVQNLKPYSNEIMLPDDNNINPKMQFSTIDMSNVTPFIQHFFNQNAFVEKESDLFTRFLPQIINDSLSSFEKIRAIQNHVVEVIGYNAIPISLLDYIPASPSMVWQSNCGNEMEKAILLNVLLKSAGFESVVGIIYSSYPFHFHACVQVEFGDSESFILSPIQNNSLSLEKNFPTSNFYFQNNQHFTAPQISPVINFEFENTLVPESSSLIMKDNYKVNQFETKTGNQNFSFNHKLKEIATNYYYIELDDGGFGINISSLQLPNHRINPLQCQATDETYQYTITLPDNYSFINKPINIIQVEKFGSLHLRITIENNQLVLIRKIKLINTTISQKEYLLFRKMILNWNDDLYKRIYIKDITK